MEPEATEEGAGNLVEATGKRVEGIPRLGLVVHPIGYDGMVSPHALHRHFFGKGNNGKGFGKGVDRILLVSSEQEFETDPIQYSYVYMRPGFAWAPTVKRTPIPAPGNLDSLPEILTEETGAAWERDTDSLTGLVRTVDTCEVEPDTMCDILMGLDAGM